MVWNFGPSSKITPTTNDIPTQSARWLAGEGPELVFQVREDGVRDGAGS